MSLDLQAAIAARLKGFEVKAVGFSEAEQKQFGQMKAQLLEAGVKEEEILNSYIASNLERIIVFETCGTPLKFRQVPDLEIECLTVFLGSANRIFWNTPVKAKELCEAISIIVAEKLRGKRK